MIMIRTSMLANDNNNIIINSIVINKKELYIYIYIHIHIYIYTHTHIIQYIIHHK